MTWQLMIDFVQRSYVIDVGSIPSTPKSFVRHWSLLLEYYLRGHTSVKRTRWNTVMVFTFVGHYRRYVILVVTIVGRWCKYVILVYNPQFRGWGDNYFVDEWLDSWFFKWNLAPYLARSWFKLDWEVCSMEDRATLPYMLMWVLLDVHVSKEVMRSIPFNDWDCNGRNFIVWIIVPVSHYCLLKKFYYLIGSSAFD